MLEPIWNDARVAMRQFHQRPGFALVVVVTLALAIGANVAVFSVVNAVLFRALPFQGFGAARVGCFRAQ
jgi:hypothetical protein